MIVYGEGVRMFDGEVVAWRCRVCRDASLFARQNAEPEESTVNIRLLKAAGDRRPTTGNFEHRTFSIFNLLNIQHQP